jgi:hypothetical protein
MTELRILAQDRRWEVRTPVQADIIREGSRRQPPIIFSAVARRMRKGSRTADHASSVATPSPLLFNNDPVEETK